MAIPAPSNPGNPPPPAQPAPGPTGIAWSRIALAMGVAVASDLFSFFTSAWIVLEPVVLAVDLVTAFLIWLALGRPIVLLAVLVAEAIPGVGALPFWSLAVGAIAVTGKLPTRFGQQAKPDVPAPAPTLPPSDPPSQKP